MDDGRNFAARLSNGELNALVLRGRPVHYRSGEELMCQGEQGESVIVLHAGLVKIVRYDDSGGTRLLGVRSSGELLGEMACIDGCPRSASVVAAGSVSGSEIPRGRFLEFLQTAPGVAREVTRQVSTRLRAVETARTAPVPDCVDLRVLRVLADLAGLLIDDQPAPPAQSVQIPLNQVELAQLVAASLVTVHRALRNLRDRRLVETRHGRVLVACVDCLLRAAATRQLDLDHGTGCGGEHRDANVLRLPPHPTPSTEACGTGGLAVSRTVISSDIVGSSSGDRHRQVHLDRIHKSVLDEAFTAVRDPRYPIATSFRRFDGDSATIVVEAVVPRAWLVADLILREIAVALADANRTVDARHRLRLRIAVDHGETVLHPPHIGGDAVTRAARLRESQPLRAAMIRSPDTCLGLIVSNRFYEDVISHGERGLDPELFTPVQVAVKDFAEQGWIHLPVTKASRTADPLPRQLPWAEVVGSATGSSNVARQVLGIVRRTVVSEPDKVAE